MYCSDNSVLGQSRRALSRRPKCTRCVWMASTRHWQVCTRCQRIETTQSPGPETRNPNAHNCTSRGRNHKQRTHVFKMLAVSKLIAIGSSANARVALRSPLSESSVQQCNETHIDSVHAERKNQRYTYETCRSRQQRPTCGRQQHAVRQAASHTRHQASTNMLGRLFRTPKKEATALPAAASPSSLMRRFTKASLRTCAPKMPFTKSTFSG